MTYMKDTVLAKELMNAVWEEDAERVEKALQYGASPSWIVNGYPMLIHAVYLENQEIVRILIEYGALQTSESLGFALDRGIGSMVCLLAYMGIVPKEVKVRHCFGMYPARFAPTSIAY